MKLTNKVPVDWKDLQNQVARLFNEAGYEAISPKTIQLVRGKKEVDVYVKAKHELLDTLICECKYWNSPIPEDVVHSFRTVVYDSGAMIGIIISKVGFQKGAIEAAKQSNVILKTWDEFQQMLLIPWTLIKREVLFNLSYPLAVYTDPFDCDDQLKNLDYKVYKKINERIVDKYMEGRCIIADINEKQLKENSYIEYHGIKYNAIDELFNDYENMVTEAIKDYENFFKDSPIDSRKLERPSIRRFSYI